METQGRALDIARSGVEVALMVSMPILAITLFIGLLVSVFQAVTQVQEQTLTFVPKVFGVALVLAVVGNWMLSTMVQFMSLCLTRAGDIR